jgi:predicted RNA-binding Zn-ribbon protein involved in translation (DUF1610 family)
MISPVHVRVCPECGEEFRPEIVRCSDCGATLEDRWDDEGASSNAAPPSAVAPPPEEAAGTYVPIYVSERAADLEPFAERLGKAGLPFQVKTAGGSFALLGREEDRERLVAALGDLLGDAPLLSAKDEPFAGYARCPACDHELAAGAIECPECGLAVGGDE